MPIIATIVILYAIWWYMNKYVPKHKETSTKPSITPEVHQSETVTSKPTNRPKKKEVRDPLGSFTDIKDYLKQGVKFHEENGKRINTRTGHPLAKQTSIDRSVEDTKDDLSISQKSVGINSAYEQAMYGDKNAFLAIDNYILGIELPYMNAGTVAYKRGDWDIAEKWWLSVLDIRPTNVTHKLEVMYRKQKRYKDIVDMYSLAVKCAKNYANLTDEDMVDDLRGSLEACGEDLLNHLNDDQSKGVAQYNSMIDYDYIDKIRSVAGSKQ